jgi:hypothetical protein
MGIVVMDVTVSYVEVIAQFYFLVVPIKGKDDDKIIVNHKTLCPSFSVKTIL